MPVRLSHCSGPSLKSWLYLDEFPSKPTLSRQQAQQRCVHCSPFPNQLYEPSWVSLQPSNWNTKVSIPEMTPQYSSDCGSIKMKPKSSSNVEENETSKPQKTFLKPSFCCTASLYCDTCHEANYLFTEPDGKNEKSIANLKSACCTRYLKYFPNA